MSFDDLLKCRMMKEGPEGQLTSAAEYQSMYNSRTFVTITESALLISEISGKKTGHVYHTHNLQWLYVQHTKSKLVCSHTLTLHDSVIVTNVLLYCSGTLLHLLIDLLDLPSSFCILISHQRTYKTDSMLVTVYEYM